MIALWVLCAVAVVISLVMAIPIGISLRYDGDIHLTVNAAFVRYSLMPKRRRRVRLRRFSKRRYEKLIAKQNKDAEKESRRKAEKDAKEKQKKPADDPGTKIAEKSTLVSDLWQMRSLLADIAGKFVRKIRTKRLSGKITIGASDAASCALIYGAASQFVVYATELVRSQTKVSPNAGCVIVDADFTSEQTTAQIEARFSVRIGSIFASAISFGAGYVKRMIADNK